ncbi:MAG: class F sortase [Acidimicrobiales bacterium]
MTELPSRAAEPTALGGPAHRPTPSGRRRMVAAVVAGVLAATGATVVAVAVASQTHPPRPSAVGPTAPTAATSPPPPAAAAPPTAGAVLPPSEPVAIDIPAIGVHSTLQYLGLTPDGALEVPAPGPLYNQAAWYKYSPTPGSLGPAIITGHVDSIKDGPSVFFRLGDLKPADRIMVTRADGLVATFNVDELRVVPKDHFPTQLVYGNTTYPALRLLTCGGPFDQRTGHYTDNVIVFASLTSTPQA